MDPAPLNEAVSGMTTGDWIALAGLLLVLGIPLAAWMTALYSKVNSIDTKIGTMDAMMTGFIAEVRPQVTDNGQDLARHSEVLSDHHRRLDNLERARMAH